MSQPTLFAPARWQPVGDRCLYHRCGNEASAVTERGLPLCGEHHEVVAETYPILRPRLLEEVA